jgi:hypothetical protein
LRVREKTAKFDEDFVRWFGHVEKVENTILVKKVYKSTCESVLPVGRPEKKVDIFS